MHKDDTSHVRAITEFLDKDDIREVPEFTSWGGGDFEGGTIFLTHPQGGAGFFCGLICIKMTTHITRQNL